MLVPRPWSSSAVNAILARPTDGLATALAAGAIRAKTIAEFVQATGLLLAETALRVERVFVSLATLHPAFRARTYLWQRGADVRARDWPHGLKNRPGYYDSPDYHVHAFRAEFRIPDVQAAPEQNCDLYGKLKRAGYRDYLMVPLRFSDGTINTLSIATREPSGFPDQAVGDFRGLADLFTIIFERFAAAETVETTLGTYLGRGVSREIMQGKIRAGHGELIDGGILFADLCDFTGHAARLGPTDTVRLLNDYFDCVVGPIEENGGYVLKFIGDAVLAFFPSAPNQTAPVDPVRAIGMIRTRLDELNRVWQARALPVLRHGLCLHFGRVLYGNVGSSERLDFTIIGDAVNVAARCVEKIKELGADYVITEAAARHFQLADDSRALGDQILRSADQKIALFELGDHGATILPS